MSGGDPLWATALASAASGAFARLCCHPLDTCKSRLQVQTERASTNRTMYKHTLDALRQTLRHEGVRGLYRGFAVTAIGAIPATCLYLTSYDVFKQRLSGMSALEGSPGGVAFTIPFCAGMLAETLSCVLWVPIDVLKERLQVQASPAAAVSRAIPVYRGSAHAIRSVWAHEGLRGMYKGYGATLLSFGPFSALYFVFYEQFKPDKDSQTASATLGTAALAGSLASFLTNPLDLVKLRLQVQRGAAAGRNAAVKSVSVAEPASTQYRSVLHGITTIMRTEGILALFKGAGARVAFHAPSTAITMSAYETFKKMILQPGTSSKRGQLEQ